MASLLSPWTSTSLNHCCRTNEACRSTQTILSFYSFRFRQRSNVKLCFQLSRAFSGSGVLNPAAPERSRNMGNCLKSDMSYINDLEEQLHELFNEVSTMIKTGKREDAVDLLQANYEAAKEQIDSGFTGIEEAAVLDVIALGHMALGDLNKVGSVLDLLSKIVEGLKNDEPLLDSILMHMGSVYEKMEEFEMSFSSYNRALAIMEREYGDASSYLIIPLLGMAKALVCLGRATKAIETYHRAISILESGKGEENEELVVPLFALGNLLLKERRTADAETAFGRIINIYMKLYGENDVKVGLALCSLADAKCSKGNIDEAIVLYRKALQILKDSECAADNKVMEKMRVDLAELLHLVGREGEGRALLEECLLITEKFNGKEHPSSVTHLVNLATSYSRSKNYAEAEKLLRISLRIMLKTLPPDDQSISFPMLHLAVALYSLNRTDEAEKYALEVLRIREKAFGKDSLPVGEALDCLVSIQSKLGKDDDELLDHLNRVLKIQEKAFGGDSEEVMETLKKIVHYMTRIGLRHEKLPLQRRLSRLRDKYKQAVKF
ncbi:PREDICTED: nephrocystin-3 [Ipomoea nil]|uniref:nephrocystin-3 n=1 Tax=Ipomoea nil TaxID=35883 RepID=UPI000901F66E|nr:PREDICTED: nephrocystin-3 [Ipomoea nil]